jgi:hypothetical protein
MDNGYLNQFEKLMIPYNMWYKGNEFEYQLQQIKDGMYKLINMWYYNLIDKWIC